MNGWLVLDKPGGVTSRAVVSTAQKWFPRGTKLGHTGTLDPLATGVLVLCIGSATRLADIVQGLGKTYRSLFRLGATSDTDDADGTVIERPVAGLPSEEAVRTALAGFVGEIQQVPPAYSAIKVEGKRSHALARRGEEVALEARPVNVYAVRLLSYQWPFVDVEIECGKGTYIRSIARDLGEKLGTGGMVQTLRRTRVGPFAVEEAMPRDSPPEAVRSWLLPLAAAVEHLSRAMLGDEAAWRFCRGQAIEAAIEERNEERVAVFNLKEELLGLALREGSDRLRPDVVLAANPA